MSTRGTAQIRAKREGEEGGQPTGPPAAFFCLTPTRCVLHTTCMTALLNTCHFEPSRLKRGTSKNADEGASDHRGLRDEHTCQLSVSRRLPVCLPPQSACLLSPTDATSEPPPTPLVFNTQEASAPLACVGRMSPTGPPFRPQVACSSPCASLNVLVPPTSPSAHHGSVASTTSAPQGPQTLCCPTTDACVGLTVAAGGGRGGLLVVVEHGPEERVAAHVRLGQEGRQVGLQLPRSLPDEDGVRVGPLLRGGREALQEKGWGASQRGAAARGGCVMRRKGRQGPTPNGVLLGKVYRRWVGTRPREHHCQ